MAPATEMETAAPPATGPLLEVVVTKEDATYQGELVEKEVGKEVTIKLATGEVKRFEWDEVLSATDRRESAPEPSGTPADGTDGNEQDTGHPPASTSTGDSVSQSPWRPIGVGVQSGYQSPLGWLGGVLEWDPTPSMGLEVGAGVGSGLGWTLAEGVASSFRVGMFCAGGRVSLLETFLSDTARVTYPRAPGMALGLGFESYLGIAIGPVEVRPFLGLQWTITDLCPDFGCSAAGLHVYGGGDLVVKFPLGLSRSNQARGE